jgi:glycosyltransferase involved in cell wall biosynthesis
MTPAAFAVPGDINLPTGGYAYARRLLALFPTYGIEAEHVPLPGGFPDPSACDLRLAERALAAVGGKVALIDGLAYGALPRPLLVAVKAPIVALVHHPLFLEAGLSAARQAALCALERSALAHAKHVVVTSTTTARTLIEEFAVPAAKITVAEPGTDRAPRAQGSGGEELRLLAVGAIVPRKAHATLVRALAPLAGRRWQLTIAGPTDRSSEARDAVEQAIAAAGLRSRVRLIGPVTPDRLAQLYASADAFVMPSLYEGYGMALGEAMARGLAIVCTTGGAAAATVPDGAALKVAPGDEAALTAALDRLLRDGALRAALADAAWAAGRRLPRWEDTARKIAEVIREVDRPAPPGARP